MVTLLKSSFIIKFHELLMAVSSSFVPVVCISFMLLSSDLMKAFLKDFYLHYLNCLKSLTPLNVTHHPWLNFSSKVHVLILIANDSEMWFKLAFAICFFPINFMITVLVLKCRYENVSRRRRIIYIYIIRHVLYMHVSIITSSDLVDKVFLQPSFATRSY